MRRGGDALATLARIRRHAVQEIGRELIDLDAAIRRHHDDRARIDATRGERADPTLPEAARFTADFLRNARALMQAQEREIARLDDETRDAQARLRDAFIELKQIELTAERNRAAVAKARADRDARAAEEQILMRWTTGDDG